MEFVSVLAGERFTDAPRCTHPGLSALARRVNDRTATDSARARLARFAPDLIGINRTDPRITESIVVVCLKAAAERQELSRITLRRLDLAQTRLAQPPPAGRRRVWGQKVRDAVHPPALVVQWAFDVLVRDDRWRLRSHSERDRDLHDLMAATIEACRRLDVGDTAESLRPG